MEEPRRPLGSQRRRWLLRGLPRQPRSDGRRAYINGERARRCRCNSPVCQSSRGSLSRSGEHGRPNPVGQYPGTVVFPTAHDFPFVLSKQHIRLHVASGVRSDLGGPPPRVGLRRLTVLRTAVPEASVDEYGNLRTPEHEIRSTPDVPQRALVYAIPEARTVQQTPHLEFALRVPSALKLHPTTNGGGARGRMWLPRHDERATASACVRFRLPR